MEIYIIAYTFGMILFLWLYSLPLKIITWVKRNIEGIFSNNSKWGNFF